MYLVVQLIVKEEETPQMQVSITFDPMNEEDMALARTFLTMSTAGGHDTPREPEPKPAPRVQQDPEPTGDDTTRAAQIQKLAEQIGKKVTKTASVSDGSRVKIGDEVVDSDGVVYIVAQCFTGTVVVEDDNGDLMAKATKDLVVAPQEDQPAPKADEAAEPDVEDAEVEEAEEDDAAPQEEVQKVIKFDDLHKLASDAVREPSIGGPGLRTMLGEIEEGVTKLSALSEKNWGTLYARLEAKLGEDALG